MDGNGRTKLGRRALLAAGAAGVAAAAAQAIAAPTKVFAADGDPVKVGVVNSGTLRTTVHSSGSDGLLGSSAAGDGLVGFSTTGFKSGLYAYSSHANGNGVFGRNTANNNQGSIAGSDHAVWGEGHKAVKAAIHGSHVVAGSAGVTGFNTADGTMGSLGGVFGVAGVAPNNLWALGVNGKATFSRSGVLTIPKNAQSAKVSSVALTSSSFIIATLNQYRSGVWIAAAIPNVASDSITIYLNKKATLATKVAWFVLEKFPGA